MFLHNPERHHKHTPHHPTNCTEKMQIAYRWIAPRSLKQQEDRRCTRPRVEARASPQYNRKRNTQYTGQAGFARRVSSCVRVKVRQPGERAYSICRRCSPGQPLVHMVDSSPWCSPQFVKTSSHKPNSADQTTNLKIRADLCSHSLHFAEGLRARGLTRSPRSHAHGSRPTGLAHGSRPTFFFLLRALTQRTHTPPPPPPPPPPPC